MCKLKAILARRKRPFQRHDEVSSNAARLEDPQQLHNYNGVPFASQPSARAELNLRNRFSEQELQLLQSEPRHQSDGLCLNCAAIDYASSFQDKHGEIDFGSPSDWTPSECRMCDFLRSCFNMPNKHDPSSDAPVYLQNVGLDIMGDFMGILQEALTPGDDCLYMQLSVKGPRDWFLIVLSSIELSPQVITPPMIDWAAVRSWLQEDSEREYEASRAAPAPAPAPAPTSTACPSSENKLVSLTVIDCANRTLVQLPENAQYTTLSYTWGSTSTVCNEE